MRVPAATWACVADMAGNEYTKPCFPVRTVCCRSWRSGLLFLMAPRRADGYRGGEGGQTWAIVPGRASSPPCLSYARAAPDVTAH